MLCKEKKIVLDHKYHKMSTIWIDQILRPLYDYEVSYLSSLQKTFQDSEQLLINVSVWGDPSKAFYIVFPILLAINQTTGMLKSRK